MRIRTTLLAGAGAVAGLVMSAAVPAGAISAGPPPDGQCTGTPYGFEGQLTSGPDAFQQSDGSQLGLQGDLCIGASKGGSSPVTGAVRIVRVGGNPEPRLAAAVMEAPGIPVKGTASGQNIRFEGRTTLDLARVADASALGVQPRATRVDIFVRAGGSTTPTARADTLRQAAPQYLGTFAGPRLKDAGSFLASPSFVAQK